MFNKKKKKDESELAISTQLANKIPFYRCYEEEGIIETSSGNFSKGYLVNEISPDEIAKTSISSARQRLELLMNNFPTNVSYEFTIHNRLVDQEKYLKQILAVPDKTDKINKYINFYNDVIVDNVGIGHNNIRKTTYFTLSVKTDFIDDAINIFRELDGKIKAEFAEIYNIEIKGLSLIARLRILYSMFNPGQNDFGKLIDLDGSGNIELKNLKYMHIGVKDIVAPLNINNSPILADRIILNEDTENEVYVRTFGIINIPREVSDNVISDLTNISSNMIYSAIHQPLNTTIGYEESKELVVKNTVTTDILKRDTVADRKAHTKFQEKNQINHSEQDYFNLAALEMFQKNIAATQKTFTTTIVITLFGATLADIDRDSELLKISADKFNFKIKSLDLQQLEGMQTVLPLCATKVDLKRVISMDRMATLCPINIQDIIKLGGLYNGLNAINDNLILLNRKNSKNQAGLIAGVEHSGKTYQCKKEIFNALISTDDDISVITTTDEYDDFVGCLDGQIVSNIHINPFYAVNGYAFQDKCGNNEKNIVFKSYFFDALITALSNIHNNNGSLEITKIEDEVALLIQYINNNSINLEDNTSENFILAYIYENKDTLPYIYNALQHLDGSSFYNKNEKSVPNNRLTLYKIKNKAELLLVLDMLRNKSVNDFSDCKSKKSPFNWIFVDPIDSVMENAAMADYLMEYIYKQDVIKTVLSFVLQDSIKIINNPDSILAFEDLINSCGYFKLLNQGPIERHKYIDMLHIPQALVGYISNVEPGKGIIITAASNIAFDDSFLPKDNPYHRLFAKDIEQIVIDEPLS